MSESTDIPLLQADQRERWQRGDRAAVELYLAQRPALAADPDGVLDLIYHEMLLREEAGEPPRLPEYLERFPHFAAELRRLFDVHQLVESAALDDDVPPTQVAADTAGPAAAATGPQPASSPVR